MSRQSAGTPGWLGLVGTARPKPVTVAGLFWLEEGADRLFLGPLIARIGTSCLSPA